MHCCRGTQTEEKGRESAEQEGVLEGKSKRRNEEKSSVGEDLKRAIARTC